MQWISKAKQSIALAVKLFEICTAYSITIKCIRSDHKTERLRIKLLPMTNAPCASQSASLHCFFFLRIKNRNLILLRYERIKFYLIIDSKKREKNCFDRNFERFAYLPTKLSARNIAVLLLWLKIHLFLCCADINQLMSFRCPHYSARYFFRFHA